MATVIPESGRALQTVRVGTVHTKRPPCGAAFSTLGAVLYILANRSAYEGAGLLVYAAPALRQTDHWFAAETLFSCLGQSTDGRLLYLLTTPGELRVANAASGELARTIQLNRPAIGLRFVDRTNV